MNEKVRFVTGRIVRASLAKIKTLANNIQAFRHVHPARQPKQFDSHFRHESAVDHRSIK
jgi:hypothetical protein